MRSRIAVALALTLGAGGGLLYADGQSPAVTAADPSTIVWPATGEAPTFDTPADVVPPSMGLYPPPVVADVGESPVAGAPPQLVFPSSYTPPYIPPTTSYVPAPSYTGAPSGAPSTVASPEPDAAWEPVKAAEDAPVAGHVPSPGSDFEPSPPQHQPSPQPSPPPSPQPNHPTPSPTPSPTPQPEPEPKPDPCAAALDRDWTCLVDTEAAPEDPAVVEDEEALLELVPEKADGTAYELTLDLGDKAETFVVVGTADLTRDLLVEYLAEVRESYADAVLVAVVDPSVPLDDPTAP
ncbi:hypothetical protein [Nocardioides sp. Arc9.136]|uniref:hypothetical protein n=1 Tax=Nocardioides sp. Arc9.136 TaxID=2996826 RepID=UPI002665F0DB|nr:hypothetical protein [Nocardioides sp. Arc9.136]WKN48026.1 hypothetical protein OSR43_18550 [Nocardioides sp. Arc9.136]